MFAAIRGGGAFQTGAGTPVRGNGPGETDVHAAERSTRPQPATRKRPSRLAQGVQVDGITVGALRKRRAEVIRSPGNLNHLRKWWGSRGPCTLGVVVMQTKVLAALAATALIGGALLVQHNSGARAHLGAPEQELGSPAVIDAPQLEPAPHPATAERRDLAEIEPVPELEHAEPKEGRAAGAFSLRVTLRELGGAPLAPGGASVKVADAIGQGHDTATDAEGVALLKDLAPGRWWVRGTAPGRSTESREVHLPSTDAGLELELRLAPRPHVRILVHAPDGRPFVDALPPRGRTLPSATASRRRPEGSLGDVMEAPRWDECGTFHIRPPTEPEPALLGRIELDCEPPLWISLHLNEDVLESQRLQPGIEELRFVVDPDAYPARLAEVVLRVVDADGARPLEGVMGHLHMGPRSSQVTFSKLAGALRFGSVMAGRTSLELSAAGYEGRVLELTLQPGERKDLGDVELSRDGSGQLAVHVRGGERVSDLQVSWTTEEQLRDREVRGTTSAGFVAPVEGDTLEIDLARGGWGVWASARRDGLELRSRLQLVQMEGGRVAVTLTLEPVATLVLEPVGRRIEVWVQTPEGLLAHSSMLGVDDLPERVALVPGSYTLLLREQGREDRVQHVDLTALGATLSVD